MAIAASLESIANPQSSRTEVQEIPDGWAIRTMGETFELQRGFDLPVQFMHEGDYPVIGSNGKIGTHSELRVKGPGVTVGRSGAVGEVHWIGSDFLAKQLDEQTRRSQTLDEAIAHSMKELVQDG